MRQSWIEQWTKFEIHFNAILIWQSDKKIWLKLAKFFERNNYKKGVSFATVLLK